jgi:UDP-galactopyranose mutase
MSYDLVIVGAGMFGASFARTMTDRGKKVLVVEKRDQLGGMCHTDTREGIVFHRYGPHVFHTNDEGIWTFVNRFAKFQQFTTRTKAIAKGRIWSFPINLMTLNQLWDVRSPGEAALKLDEVRVRIENPDNIEDWVLATYGREIYETFFLGYTLKQWGRDPRSLPAAIARRLHCRLTFEDAYFSDRFEGVPDGGYAPMFQKMLDGIEVKTGCDFIEERTSLERQGRVVYSGRIDEFFGYKFGELAFRTCKFETKSLMGDFQGNPVVNYCDAETPWTRIVEHKHFSNPRAQNTLVTREYPGECGRGGTPLYPINDVANMEIYRKYTEIPTDTIFAGRLGSYRYFDMCEVIAQAWKLAERLS